MFRLSKGLTNRQRSEDETDGTQPVPRLDIQHRSAAPGCRATPLDLEGAFPLLLIGSALLCYAAVLANEELSFRERPPSSLGALWGSRRSDRRGGYLLNFLGASQGPGVGPFEGLGDDSEGRMGSSTCQPPHRGPSSLPRALLP